MIKTRKRKLLISFMALLMIITTLLSYNSYAAEISEKYVNGSGITGGPITFDMLDTLWDILCGEHGKHIPSEKNATQVYTGPIGSNPSKSTVGSVEEFESYSETVDAGESSSYSSDADYKTNHIAIYSSNGLKIATPKEAYILNEAPIKGGSNDSEAQIAWWTTGANIGHMEGTNDLAETAAAYETFVKKIAKNVDDTSTYKTYSHQYDDGTIVSIKFPELNEEKLENMISFNTVNTVDGGYEVKKTGDSWASNVTVSYDEESQKYMIGPFSINYIEASYNGVDFGVLSGFEVYTDASSQPLSKDNWRFVWLEGQRSQDDVRIYPASNEVFYIEMDYVENATMITGMDIDYKYLMAGGAYEELDGKYDVTKWVLNKTEFEEFTGTYDEQGEPINAKKWRYYFTKENGGIGESQMLDTVQMAARWYEIEKIQMRANQGNIEIVKKAVDEAGNELTADQVKEKFGEDQYFDFKLTITHADGRVEDDVVTVKAGESVKKNYSWTGEESAPTFKVEEVPVINEAWKFVSINPQSGTLQDNGTVTVTAVNQIKEPKSNRIQITKTLSGPAETNEEFKFEVVVTMPDGEKKSTIASIIVPQGQVSGNTWVSEVYTWYGEKAPTYEVVEIETEASKLYTPSINPSSGELDGTGANIVVNAYNHREIKEYSNRIQINKTLEGGPAATDEVFKFKVTITEADSTVHEEVAEIIVPQGQITGTPWLSQEYTWKEGQNAPTYTVEEIEIPEGYTAVITPASGALDNTKSVIRVDAINYKEKKELMNRIEINKTIDGGIASTDEVFKFRVTVTNADGTRDEKIATITVPAGQITGNAWVSDSYTWKEGEKAPTYKIEEIEVPAGYTPEIINGEGTLDGSKAKVIVNAINYKEEHKGYLTIEKDLLDGQMTDETFDFKVTVNGVKNTESGTVEFTVTGVKPGEKKGPYEFMWEGETAPTYTVEEINLENSEAKVSSITATANGESAGTASGNKITGQLVKDGTANVEVKFTNTVTEHSGNIKVVKDIYTTEKISKETLEAEGAKFEIEVVIEGTFSHDGKNYEDTTKVITKSLPENGNWEFEINNIKWYGKEAPTYTVREISMPTGWRTRTITYSDLENESTESEGHNLIDGKTVTATIVNELPSEIVIDLTFSMAGLVWVDDTLDPKNQDDYYNQPNGVYDKVEELKENAEVTVYRVVYDQAGNEVERTVAKAYKDKDNNELTFPIITKSDGKWDVPRISVPALSDSEKAAGYSVSYDVEFAYDGENYEPTEFLSYKIGADGSKTKNSGTTAERASAYRGATTSEKDKYAKDSMALEYSNEARRIAEVSGKTAIDANGDTTGIVTIANDDGTFETREVTYSSDNAGTGYPTISRVNTTDKDGRVLDVFKATARTSTATLTFPFDKDGYDGISLQNINKTVDELGVHHKYQYMAVYNYCLNINLGLKERATVDVELTKNLDNAKVIVNEKLYQYKYSGNYDLTEDKLESLDKDIMVDKETEEIEYTLDLYKSDYYYRADMYRNGEIYGALQSFYKTLNKTPEDTEMDIYLTYKIKLRNTSSSYDVVVDSIDDYYDSSFTLIRADETKYLKTQTVGGTESDVNDEVVVANASDYADKWVDVKTGIVGSDKDADGNNIIYNKMTADNLGIKLEAGKDAEIRVAFKIDKSKETENAVANSIKLGQKSNVAEIGSYSTYFAGTSNNAGKIDRDSAPSNVNISANNTKAWYEDDTFAAPRLKVNVKPEGVRTVGGVAWEDNSKNENTENPGYNQQVGNGIKDSGENGIENLSTELVEKVIVLNTDGTYTEYDYIWPTAEKLDILNGKTIEEVSGFDSSIVTGVDGIYEFSNVAAGDYVVRFTYGDTKIESQDYSEARYYNGQDYKSSKFTSSLKEGTTLRADSYLDAENLPEGRNAAVDSEVRRLEVVQKSREITYDNASIMAEYQDALFTDYYMFADTPKIDMNVELSNFGDNEYTYDVKNVDFGLEERPITKLTLDKQIEEMLLTTSDGNTIMNAKYNINYVVDEDGEITAEVTLDEANSYGTDKLQALNRDLATNQGFRYINVDTEILEAATITVKYRFTVLNTGEVDRTGELANMDYKTDSTTFDAARTDLSNRLATYSKDGNKLTNGETQGKYVGSIYYYGKDGSSSDEVVTSTVRQLVDYIDNDATFSGMLNSTANTSWSNITVAELKELIKDEIVTDNTILDSDGVQYETENRNNLVVSVDSTESTLNNAGFIVELMPNNAAGDSGKDRASMNLTVTRYVGADSDDLQIDNIAEIIKYNNEVGRRDELTIPGNQNPATELEPEVDLGTPTTVSAGMPYERDTSATEVITLSPPTGSGLMIWKLQVIGSITAGLVIIAGGIILIKKKVLK